MKIPFFAPARLAGFLAAFAVSAQPIPLAPVDAPPVAPAVAPPLANAPRITFEQPIHDFGKARTGEVIRHDYLFTNTGNATLEITSVKPGCGCTTAGTWDRQIEPGKSGRIPIQYTATANAGPTVKGITVTCNDPAQPSVYLQIKGTIWTPISVLPSSAYFNIPSDSSSNETKVIRIVSNLDEPLQLSDPIVTNAAFSAQLKAVKPGKEFELHITARPPFEASYVTTPISLNTSSKDVPIVSLPAVAIVQPAVSVVPSIVNLPATTGAAGAQAVVNIRNSSTKPLQLSEPTINLTGATVALQEVQPGRLFRLSVQVPPEIEVPPGQRFEATVKSDHPKFPIIRVPVLRVARPSPAVVPRATPNPGAPAVPTLKPLHANPTGAPVRPAPPTSR